MYICFITLNFYIIKKSILTIGLTFLTIGTFAGNGYLKSSLKTINQIKEFGTHPCVNSSIGAAVDFMESSGFHFNKKISFGKAYKHVFRICISDLERERETLIIIEPTKPVNLSNN